MSTRRKRVPHPTSLDNLDPIDQQIIANLRHGLNYCEIARIVEMHSATVRDRVSAMRRLHEQQSLPFPERRGYGRNAISTTATDISPLDRQIIDLFAAGSTLTEIAATLGNTIARQTVATRLCRLRDQLGEDIVPRRRNDCRSLPRDSLSNPADPSGIVRCLGGCGQHFRSPDRCRIRICSRCKSKHAETSSLTEHRLFTA